MGEPKGTRNVAITTACVTSAVLVYRCWRDASRMPQFKKAKGVPFFGILFQIAGGLQIVRVLEDWASKIGDEGVFEVTLVGQRSLVVCNWEQAKKVLEPRPSKVRRTKDFESFKEMVDGLFLAEGAQWKRHRQLLGPAFHPKMIPNYLPLACSVVDMLGAHLSTSAGGKLNISKLMQRTTSSILVKVLTGNDIFSSDFLPHLLNQLDSIGEIAIARVVCPVPYWKIPLLRSILPSNKTVERMNQMFAEIIDKAGADPEGKTLLSKMVEAHDGDKLSHQELLGNVGTLLIAGTDTTSITVSWACYELSHRPDLQASIAAEVERVAPRGVSTAEQVEELKLARAVWNETLRIHSPGPYLILTTLTDLELAGKTVPAGTNIFCLDRYCSRHSDKTKEILGEDLDAWRPERWFDKSKNLQKFAPLDTLGSFGYGSRSCLGKHLADLEGTLLISEVCRRIKMAPCEHKIYEVTEFTTHPDQDIVLEASKRV